MVYRVMFYGTVLPRNIVVSLTVLVDHLCFFFYRNEMAQFSVRKIKTLLQMIE